MWNPKTQKVVMSRDINWEPWSREDESEKKDKPVDSDEEDEDTIEYVRSKRKKTAPEETPKDAESDAESKKDDEEDDGWTKVESPRTTRLRNRNQIKDDEKFERLKALTEKQRNALKKLSNNYMAEEDPVEASIQD